MIKGCHAALLYLLGTPGSAIANVASTGGRYGGSELTVYCATKFGVRGLSEALDAEFAAYGVKVECACHGSPDLAWSENPASGQRVDPR